MKGKRIITSIAALAAIGTAAFPQQAITPGGPDVSPEIHPDRTVTFRLEAPGAKEVKLLGDWMPSTGWIPGSVPMLRDSGGIWTHTTGVLEPELYSYSFLVDGLRVNDPNNAFVSRDIATLSNIFLIGGERADLYSVREVPHGSVTRRWYPSPRLGMDRRISIYTPPGYESSGKDYPVLYLLHGAGGDEEAWLSLGRSAQIMDNLIADGMVEPMIMVMPNGNVSQDAAPGEGSRGFIKPRFMVPGTMDGTFEETFPEIMEFVENSYRVKPGKPNRAIAGLSMGGFHAMHLSRYYPETFDYVGLFSPAILPPQGSGSKIYDDMDGTMARQRDNGYRLYWIGIGKEDFLYQNVITFTEKLDALDMRYTYRESEGGHIWKNWRIYLSEFLPQLYK